MYNIELPENVIKIIEKLQRHGFEAFAVGGCIRDSILGRVPDDWDITTNALPLEIKSVFDKTVDTGIEHGTVTVLMGKEQFEVTTYRVDGEYLDMRHPENVNFTKNLEEDLKRRDFTINAMAFNDRDGLVDIFEGREDLDRKLIRCVGDPLERFSEDALRILRAIRFKAQLGFSLDPGTGEAIRTLCENLKAISVERVQEELKKLLMSDRPEYIQNVVDYGITEHVLTWCEPTQVILEALKRSARKYPLRLAVLMYKGTETDPEEVHRNLRALKLDNITINMAVHTVEYMDLPVYSDEVVIRRNLHACGEEVFENILDLKLAFTEDDEIIAEIEKCREAMRQVLLKKQCFRIKDLAIDGRKLLELGCQQGPVIGDILEKLLGYVIEDQSMNTAEILEREAVKLIS